MNKIEKLDLIIKLYYEGKYSIGTFADVFSETILSYHKFYKKGV